MADKKIALALSALVPVDEFVPLIDKAPDVFIFVLVRLAYLFGFMAVFLPLLFLLGKDSRILDRSLFSLDQTTLGTGKGKERCRIAGGSVRQFPRQLVYPETCK